MTFVGFISKNCQQEIGALLIIGSKEETKYLILANKKRVDRSTPSRPNFLEVTTIQGILSLNQSN
ncbi:hypothetical protein [Pediococcus acidilactici]|uniref:hypothetical protein n=1 Tax=Pediococcus acidilactici TaxID=1254 RepID=UPI00133066BF|nr:hypothetical protein [Pediococcus acidilactici]